MAELNAKISEIGKLSGHLKISESMPIPIPGPKGEDGKSAYQIALDNGFVGTEVEWLASLQGEQGPEGPQGPKGEDGTMSFEDLTPEQKESLKGDKGDQGPIGPKGDKGNTGETGAQGPQGIKGDKGDQGIQGEKGDKGDKGDSYTITEADYDAIAAIAVTKLPTAEGGTY